MRIAILGTAPSSVRLAPFGDSSWQIWACSPGTYPILPRCEKFFEIHRWEPGVIGRPETQKSWFSPEYVMWLAQRECGVVMTIPAPEIKNAIALPVKQLTDKYGHFNFTSTIAWMLAMAIEEILEQRAKTTASAKQAEADGQRNFCAPPPDMIGLWGVDMAATEEYGYQRAGCQFFVQLAADLDIQIVLPPESDLMTPPPLYGVFESSHKAIKLTQRKRELEGQLAHAKQVFEESKLAVARFEGALDDLNYIMNNWMFEGEVKGVEFKQIFAPQVSTVSAPTAEEHKGTPRRRAPRKTNGADHTEAHPS